MSRCGRERARISGYRARWPSRSSSPGRPGPPISRSAPLEGSPDVTAPNACSPVAASPGGIRAPVPRTPISNPCERRTNHSLRDDRAPCALFGPDPDGLPVVAAGAPWFMTLFGSDSMLTSLMACCSVPGLALGALDPRPAPGHLPRPGTEEHPGRILHEVRATAALGPMPALLRHRRRDAALRHPARRAARWGLPWERLGRCCRTATARWSGSTTTATATATATSSTSGSPPRARRTRAGRTRGRHRLRRRVARRGPDRPRRGAGLRLRGQRAGAALAGRAGVDAHRRVREPRRRLRDRFDARLLDAGSRHFALALDGDKHRSTP